MFDTRIYRVYGPNQIQIDINQKETTSLEAARLYADMLDKARAEVLESVAFDNSVVDFHALRINTGIKTKIVVAFKLNGDLYVTEVPLEGVEILIHQNKMQLIKFVHRRMAEVIAEKLLENIESL